MIAACLGVIAALAFASAARAAAAPEVRLGPPLPGAEASLLAAPEIGLDLALGPVDAEVSPDGSRLYVASSGSNTVSVIDTATEQVVGPPYCGGENTAEIAVSADGGKGYVLSLVPGELRTIDLTVPQDETAGCAFEKRLKFGTLPQEIVFSDDEELAYVVDSLASALYIVDTGTDQVEIETLPQRTPTGLIRAGSYVYTVAPDEGLVKFNTVTNEVEGEPMATGGFGPQRLVMPDGGREIYVANAFSNTVTVFDTATDQIVGGPIEVGLFPSGMAATPDGSRVLVVNSVANTVSIINTETKQVEGPPIEVGEFPAAVAVSPDGATAYVPNATSNTVSVLDIASDRTETRLSCGEAPVSAGATVTCEAIVDDLGIPSVLSGAVVFSSTGAGEFSADGRCNLQASDGEVSCEIEYTPAKVGSGSHQVTASYQGEERHMQSMDQADLAVVTRPSGIELACGPPPLVEGRASICTATVADLGSGATAPTGTVSFASDAPGSLPAGAICELSSAGGPSASCAVAFRPDSAGTFTLEGSYAGDEDHEKGDALTRLEVIRAPAPVSSAISCTPATALVGASVTCTATIADAGTDPGAPTGDVQFTTDGGGSFSGQASCSLVAATRSTSTCSATYVPSSLGSGVHRLSVAYLGDAKHKSGAATAQVKVTVRPNTLLGKKKPAKRATSSVARFTFVSDQADAGFECKLDKQKAKPCRSPLVKKVGKGAHRLQVWAVNVHGLRDPSPAEYRWKVLAKRR